MTKKDDPLEAIASDGSGAERHLSGGAFYAKTLLDRHGIATPERSRLVEKVLDLAYSAAHRRIRGQASWSFEELAALAQHFGESLDDVFIAAAKTRAESSTFVVGGLRLKSQLWLGPQIARGTSGSVVAVKEGPRWVVVPASDEPPGPCFEVRQLLLEPNAVAGSRIAVLDDQPTITESLCVFLRQAGFKADAYHSIGALHGALTTLAYDAYVLDWLVGDETVAGLVEQLRSMDAQCPIAILTGKADEQGKVVSDIADLVARHDVRYFSKPLNPHIITAVLTRHIATQTRG